MTYTLADWASPLYLKTRQETSGWTLVLRPAHRSPSFSSNSPVFFFTSQSSSLPKNQGPTWEWKERRQSPGKSLCCSAPTWFSSLFLSSSVFFKLQCGWTPKRDLADNWRSRSPAEIQWSLCLLQAFPVLCLSINSLLNPFLYAPRHPKVKPQLDPLLSRCWAATRECFGNMWQKVRCHATNAESINTREVELQEERIPQGAFLPEEGNDEVQSQLIPSQCPSQAN